MKTLILPLFVTCCLTSLLRAEPLVLVSASYQKNILALCEIDGSVIWQYRTSGPERGHAGHHEVQMLDNGHILFHDDWNVVKEIKLDGTEVWRYAGSGVHSFRRLKDGNTMIAESGKERVIIVDADGKLIQETPLGKDGRGKTRQVEVLASGNMLVCAENPGTVTEYTRDGEIVWEYNIGTRVYGAIRRRNGNTLICSGSGNSVVEVSPEKQIVWEIKDRIPDSDIGLHWTACLVELPGGDIVIDNCHAGPNNPQLIRIDSDRKVVWQFNRFDLVGNGMACFDYIDDQRAAELRKMVSRLPKTK